MMSFRNRNGFGFVLYLFAVSVFDWWQLPLCCGDCSTCGKSTKNLQNMNSPGGVLVGASGKKPDIAHGEIPQNFHTFPSFGHLKSFARCRAAPL